MTAIVLVARKNPTYDDVPGKRYHFPRARYEGQLRDSENTVALIYEPRRGGNTSESATGGSQAFIAWAMLGRIEADAARPDHAYVNYTMYQEFPASVPLRETPVIGKALQSAVLRIDDAVAEQIILRGLAPLLDARPASAGLTPRDIPPEIRARPAKDVIRNELVRDRAFRYRVVDCAYEGRCAMTGLRLTNGLGRAEVDAAHIVPVDKGGPDSTSNGIALTKTLHWAFDRGLVSIDVDGRILTSERGFPDDLRRLLNADMRIRLPRLESDSPHAAFVTWHRDNVYKGRTPGNPRPRIG